MLLKIKQNGRKICVFFLMSEIYIYLNIFNTKQQNICFFFILCIDPKMPKVIFSVPYLQKS